MDASHAMPLLILSRTKACALVQWNEINKEYLVDVLQNKQTYLNKSQEVVLTTEAEGSLCKESMVNTASSALHMCEGEYKHAVKMCPTNNVNIHPSNNMDIARARAEEADCGLFHTSPYTSRRNHHQLQSTNLLSMLRSVLPVLHAGKLPCSCKCSGHHRRTQTLQIWSDRAESPSSLRAHTGILCAGAFCAAVPVRRRTRHHTLQGALQPQAQLPDAEHCLAGYLQLVSYKSLLLCGPDQAQQPRLPCIWPHMQSIGRVWSVPYDLEGAGTRLLGSVLVMPTHHSLFTSCLLMCCDSYHSGCMPSRCAVCVWGALCVYQGALCVYGGTKRGGGARLPSMQVGVLGHTVLTLPCAARRRAFLLCAASHGSVTTVCAHARVHATADNVQGLLHAMCSCYQPLNGDPVMHAIYKRFASFQVC